MNGNITSLNLSAKQFKKPRVIDFVVEDCALVVSTLNHVETDARLEASRLPHASLAQQKPRSACFFKNASNLNVPAAERRSFCAPRDPPVRKKLDPPMHFE